MGQVPRRARPVLLAAALALAGCETPYAPYSVWNQGGFTETEVQPGVYMVMFVGNDQTNPARSADFALLRAAELCLWRDDAFLFVGDVATQYAHHVSAPAPVTTVAPDGNGNVVASTQSTAPIVTQSPSSGVTVTCVADKQPGAWDAAWLARTIRAKYSMGRSLAAGS